MKTKSIILLLVFCISGIPARPTLAEESISHKISDAYALMYISDAILLPDPEIDDSIETSWLSSPAMNTYQKSDADPLLARMIHAKKMERNDLDAACRLLQAYLIGQDQECEAQKAKEYCQSKRAEINAQIGYFRKLRGDRRKFFTRIWHSVKRGARNFWQRIGKFGRNFLRNLGEEALQIVLTGGSLSGGALKKLIKHHAKTMGRKRIKEIVYTGVQKMLQGQLDIAKAAGIDICKEEEKEETQVASEEQEQEEQESLEFNLPTSGVWDLSCQHTHEAVVKDFPDVTWKLKITWDSKYFEGYIDGTSTEIEDNETTSWVWHEEGVGDVTPDGFLWGDSVESMKYSHAYGTNKPSTDERFYEGKWLGAISEDLDKVCLFRVGAQQIDLDWLRERGRQEMLEYPGALCEGLCIVK
jgi:hypothetical protein